MISVLVANPKGGCGKTTIATHLAAAFANGGLRTALADTDRQRSCLGWLDARPDWLAPRKREAGASGAAKPPSLWIGPEPAQQNEPPAVDVEFMAQIARKYDTDRKSVV